MMLGVALRGRSLVHRLLGRSRILSDWSQMSDDAGIRPFRIDIPQRDVDDLGRRLELSRWPDELPNVGWDYGVASGFLPGLADYWRTGYDWRAHERRLNDLPQFITEIDGPNTSAEATSPPCKPPTSSSTTSTPSPVS